MAQTPTGDAPQAATQEEKFFSGDLSSLPPQLREHATKVNKEMARAFTEKTQRLAEERKSIDEFRKKSDLYDQISADEAFVNYWTNLDKQGNGQQAQAPSQAVSQETGLQLTDEDYAASLQTKEGLQSFVSKLIQASQAPLKQELTRTQQALMVSKATEAIADFSTERDKDGKLLRPDFKTLEEDGYIDQFLRQNPPRTATEYGKSLGKAYESARKLVQKEREIGKKEAMAALQSKNRRAPRLSRKWPGRTVRPCCDRRTPTPRRNHRASRPPRQGPAPMPGSLGTRIQASR